MSPTPEPGSVGSATQPREGVNSMATTISPADSIRQFLDQRGNDMELVRAAVAASGIPARQVPGVLAWIRGEYTPDKTTVTKYRRILDEIDGRAPAGRGRPLGGEPLNAHNPSGADGYVRFGIFRRRRNSRQVHRAMLDARRPS